MTNEEFKFEQEHKGIRFFVDESGIPSFGKIEEKDKILSVLEYNKCYLVLQEDFHEIEIDYEGADDCLFYQDFKKFAWRMKYFNFIKQQKQITKFYLGKENWILLATSKEQNLAYMVAPFDIDWIGLDEEPKKHTCMSCQNTIYEGKITWIISEFKLSKRPYCNSICLKNDENLENF